MEAGKHVLVEKPFATNVSEAEAMASCADRNGVTLMVGHTFEYHAAVWALRAMISSGELGELYYLDTARLNLGLYQRDVNVLFDLAPHDISILNYVLGRQPGERRVLGFAPCPPPTRGHRLHALFATRSPDVEANVHVSWLDPCKVRRVTVVGSAKMVVFDDLDTEERIRVHNKGVVEPSGVEDLTQPPMSYRYGEVVAPYVIVNEPLGLEDEHFVDCALTGMQPLTGAANGLAVVRVLEAAELSFRERREVAIAEIGGAEVDDTASATTDGTPVNGAMVSATKVRDQR